jgi:hypothetical protein
MSQEPGYSSKRMFAQLDIEKLVSKFVVRTAIHYLTTIPTVRLMCEYGRSKYMDADQSK